MPDLLIELLSEEIPARIQGFAAQELRKNMLSFLAEQGLSEIAATAFSTPRRLTLFMTGIPEKSDDFIEERKGPRVDAPQKALDGFLRSVDLELGYIYAASWAGMLRRFNYQDDNPSWELVPLPLDNQTQVECGNYPSDYIYNPRVGLCLDLSYVIAQ